MGRRGPGPRETSPKKDKERYPLPGRCHPVATLRPHGVTPAPGLFPGGWILFPILFGKRRLGRPGLAPEAMGQGWQAAPGDHTLASHRGGTVSAVSITPTGQGRRHLDHAPASRPLGCYKSKGQVESQEPPGRPPPRHEGCAQESTAQPRGQAGVILDEGSGGEHAAHEGPAARACTLPTRADRALGVVAGPSASGEGLCPAAQLTSAVLRWGILSTVSLSLASNR